MMGKSSVEVLREVTGDNSIQTIPEGLEKALSGGGGGGVLIVHVNEETGALDKTWQEIYDAGFCVMERYFEEEGTTSKGYFTISGVGFEGDEFFVGFFGADGAVPFIADSADGYPELDQSGDGGTDPNDAA